MTEPLPPLREIIRDFDLGAKKSLGQHFLLDLNVTAKIARLADVGDGDAVLEVGPGPGGLTRALLSAGARVVAVERDKRCIGALELLDAHFPGQLTLIEGDALEFDETVAFDGASYKIVANLPYNVSTELLIKWLRDGAGRWTTMALMFQKEVADRILAAPGSKSYGRLSVIAQAASTPSRGFNLPARAFSPPPKVDSTVVVFNPPTRDDFNFTALERVTQAAFSQRRKMVRSSLKTAFAGRLGEVLMEVGIAETQRAEEISVDQFLALADRL